MGNTPFTSANSGTRGFGDKNYSNTNAHAIVMWGTSHPNLTAAVHKYCETSSPSIIQVELDYNWQSHAEIKILGSLTTKGKAMQLASHFCLNWKYLPAEAAP